MPINVLIPTPLRKLTGRQETVQVVSTSIGDMIAELEGRYPGMRERLLDDSREVRRFILVYVNDEDIRFLQGQKTSLKDGDTVSIIPAIAGG